MTILPTHTCFDDVFDFLEMKIKDDIEKVRSNKYLVCHGIINPAEGNLSEGEISHAWIEEDNMVWFSGIVDKDKVWCQCSKEEYYRESNVLDVTRYTVYEVAFNNQKHTTYGPWEERYLKLCGKQRV